MNSYVDHSLLRHLASRHGTPLWVYDADTIRQRVAELRAFDVVRYAQKANANIHLLRTMRELGVLVDAVSLGEIERAQAAGYPAAGGGASPLVFTADLIDAATLERVVRDRIPVNAGSIDMLRQLAAGSPAHPVWLRVNPGFGHGHSRKTNTGGEHSKHGIWHTELEAAEAVIREGQLRLVGLHMHIGSGVDPAHLERVAAAMVEAAARVRLSIESISAGGGLPVPGHRSEARIDLQRYFQIWDAARRQIVAARGHPVQLEIEPGRYLVAEAGLLVARVCAVKMSGRNRFVLVDAGFNELARPVLYGARHEIDLLPSDHSSRPVRDVVVAGPLCEAGDVFTQGPGGEVATRELPEARSGDLLVFRNAGAYGASMSSNYNSRPLAAEVLVETGEARLIRRRQRMEELLALELDVG